MDIGTGIAILGAWLFPTAAIATHNVPGKAVWASLLVTSIATTVFLYQ